MCGRVVLGRVRLRSRIPLCKSVAPRKKTNVVRSGRGDFDMGLCGLESVCSEIEEFQIAERAEKAGDFSNEKIV